MKSLSKSNYLFREKNNFDLIRLSAAFLVLIHHSSSILYGYSLKWDPFEKLIGMNMGNLGVKVFFIISGFLIAKSWQNKDSIFSFTIARFLRIYPAAIVVVLISVLFFGFFISTLSFAEYISHSTTLQYLQNCSIYRMYYNLPGVFENNPISGVNGSLWTLPYEFTCYIIIGIIGIIGLIKNKVINLCLFTALILGSSFFYNEINQIVIPVLGIDFKTFYPLLLFFYSGTIYYQFRDKIKYNLWLFLIGFGVLFLTKNTPEISYQIKVILLPYLVLYFAFSKKINPTFLTKNIDLSYGLYLYAFPIQQLTVHLFKDELNLFTFTAISTLLSLLMAYLSWTIIENPALKARALF